MKVIGLCWAFLLLYWIAGIGMEDSVNQIPSSLRRQRCQIPGGGGGCWSADLTDTWVTLGRDSFKHDIVVAYWVVYYTSLLKLTCLAWEVRITSIRELDESVTLVCLGDYNLSPLLCTRACPEITRKSKWLSNRPPNRLTVYLKAYKKCKW